MQQNTLAAQKIVVPVRFDQSAYRHNQHADHQNDDQYNVLENEILVIDKKQRVVDNYRVPRVRSWWKQCGTATEDAEEIRKVKFFGIAVTPHVASVKYTLDQGFVACTDGICKAVNESEETIHVGELLTYDHNKRNTKQRGVPPRKCRFTFVKYDPQNTEHHSRGIVAKALSNAKQHASYDVQIYNHSRSLAYYIFSYLGEPNSATEKLRRLNQIFGAP